jgi:MinD-like ATPase involved in chromosome partitioning or flagellar assembly
VPIGDRDVVRAAFAWNLVVEVARLGGSGTLLAPEEPEPSPLWPQAAAGQGPVGAELVLAKAGGLAELNRAALDIAVSRAAETADGGVVLVRVPPAWLGNTQQGRALLHWVLLFASTEQRDLMETYGLAKRVLATSAQARVGVTIHGARRIGEAERAFHHVAGVLARHLGRTPLSYGLLVDDLHVYRAIVSQRPIGIEHPQSRAARALRDVAQLVLEDARKFAVA